MCSDRTWEEPYRAIRGEVEEAILIVEIWKMTKKCKKFTYETDSMAMILARYRDPSLLKPMCPDRTWEEPNSVISGEVKGAIFIVEMLKMNK